MTRSKLWPEVATALDELNESARSALAIGPQVKPAEAKQFPWPSWAPAPGAWVRQAYQGASPDDRVLSSETWHIASGVLFESEANRFELKPLCGRQIRLQTDRRPRVDGPRLSTFDLREVDLPSDKECWHCLRKRALGADIGPGSLHRPWGDIGAGAFYASIGLGGRR
jgi:hypothetical protein